MGEKTVHPSFTYYGMWIINCLNISTDYYINENKKMDRKLQSVTFLKNILLYQSLIIEFLKLKRMVEIFK